MNGLRDRAYVIAGGATGIGAATAERLAAEGARVVVGDSDAGGAAATVEKIGRTGAQARTVPFDLGDATSIEGLFDTATREFGACTGYSTSGPTCPLTPSAGPPICWTWTRRSGSARCGSTSSISPTPAGSPSHDSWRPAAAPS